MSEIVSNLLQSELHAAIDANMAEEMAVFGRYLPAAEIHETPEMTWMITGSNAPGRNGVLLTHLTADTIDAQIEEMQKLFTQRRLTLSWTVGPSMRPTALSTYLERHTFQRVHEDTVMAVDIQSFKGDQPIPPELSITVVTNQSLLDAYFQASRKGFGSSAEGAKIYYDTYSKIGFGEHLPWQHFIGWLHGEPVAASSLLLHAGIAGIYGVTTIPEARRQGIGAAMTLVPLREAGLRGYHVGILSPSEMGFNVYRQLGFQTYCKRDYYRWQP